MKNVKDIYPVSPMQELMLLHTTTRSARDTLFNQFCFDVGTSLDVERFQAAWQAVTRRHDALRTGFLWEGMSQPQQVVRTELTLDFDVQDWREQEPAEQEQAFQRFLAKDRHRGFDLRRAPLMRFALIRLDDDRWRFVWSSHHLIIDRWCLGSLFAELGRAYAGHDIAAEPAPSYRDYIGWINRQDRRAAFDYWSGTLRGLRHASRATSASDADEPTTATRDLSESGTAALLHVSRRLGVTPGVIAQASWALTLNGLTGRQDIVFGMTVAGRPPGLPDVEHIVGSFINNVPVRVRLPAAVPIREWLVGLQAAQFERAEYEYLAPGDIQRSLGASDVTELFDSLIVWLAGSDQIDGLPMTPLSTQFETAYPLTLSIFDDGERLHLRVDCRTSCNVPVDELLERFESSIGALVDRAETATLGTLPGFQRDADDTAGPVADSGWSGDTESTIDGAERAREPIGTDVLREMLRYEWSNVLGRPIDADDADFFAIGGTSLQAARLHARIEVSTRQSLPMLALFREPTIDSMVRTLFENDWPVLADSILGLRVNGGGLPLFCIASPEVNTIGYSMLMRCLPQDQDVYVLQAPPVSGEYQQMDPAAVPEYAARYRDCVRRVQPHGPYQLISMCDGAHIAMEMVRGFENEGDEVGYFGIVNTWSLYTVSRLVYVNRFLNVLGYYIERIAGLVRRRTPIAEEAETSSNHAELSRRTSAAPAEATVGLANPWIRNVGFVRCDPGRPRVRTPVTVYRVARQPFWRIRDRALGWGNQATDVRVVALACEDHYSVMRPPFVEQLGDTVRQQLDQRRVAPPLTDDVAA